MFGSREVSGSTLSFIYRIEMDNGVKIIILNDLKLFFPHFKEQPMRNRSRRPKRDKMFARMKE